MKPLVVESEPAFRTRHANPYNALLATGLRDLGVVIHDLSFRRLLVRRVDIVHLHWPELTFLSGHRPVTMAIRMLLFRAILRVARLRGTRVVWTVHNVDAHEKRGTPRLRSVHRRLLVREVDGILALSAANLADALEAYPEFVGLPAAVTPHGHYRDAYPFDVSRAEARERLGLEPGARVLLSAGQVRPYKDIPRLVRTFAALDDRDARLVVAGRATPDSLADEISGLAARDPRVVLDLAFLDDERLALWVRAADLVVLPYRAVTNSGSAILALSADRPVLVPDMGSLGELADEVGRDWVTTYTGDLDVTAIRAALDRARAVPPGVGVDLAAFEWDIVARKTRDAYRAVLASPRSTRRTPHTRADRRAERDHEVTR